MDVLFITHAFPRTADDAAGSFILRLAVALRDEGVRATVVAPHASGLAERETTRGVPVRRFRYAPERYETLAYSGTMAQQVGASWAARLALGGLIAAAVRSAAQLAREVRPQLIHAHWWFPSGLAGAAVAGLRRLPMVTTLHGSDVRLAHQTRGARQLYAQVASRSAVVTAVSRWLAARAAALAPRAAEPRVEPMPTDVALFSPGGRRCADRLLFVGRLTPQKGADLLLRALAELPAEISLDVVGDGPEDDNLRHLAGALGISARVRWHGSLPQSALADLYRVATAVVVPSVDEGLGLVAVEAQLCEAPVIAFDSGGLRDVISQGETGVLASAVSAPALAAAVRELLARPDRGTSLGRAGRAQALSRFAPHAVARRYSAIYQEATDHFHHRTG